MFETLFRVLQESITNVIRHSGATHLDVEIGKESENVVMRIRDNGSLNKEQELREGFGLRMMRDRLEDKGGSLVYRIPSAGGLEIVAVLPGDERLYPITGKEEGHAGE